MHKSASSSQESSYHSLQNKHLQKKGGEKYNLKKHLQKHKFINVFTTEPNKQTLQILTTLLNMEHVAGSSDDNRDSLIMLLCYYSLLIRFMLYMLVLQQREDVKSNQIFV